MSALLLSILGAIIATALNDELKQWLPRLVERVAAAASAQGNAATNDVERRINNVPGAWGKIVVATVIILQLVWVRSSPTLAHRTKRIARTSILIALLLALGVCDFQILRVFFTELLTPQIGGIRVADLVSLMIVVTSFGSGLVIGSTGHIRFAKWAFGGFMVTALAVFQAVVFGLVSYNFGIGEGIQRYWLAPLGVLFPLALFAAGTLLQMETTRPRRPIVAP